MEIVSKLNTGLALDERLTTGVNQFNHHCTITLNGRIKDFYIYNYLMLSMSSTCIVSETVMTHLDYISGN